MPRRRSAVGSRSLRQRLDGKNALLRYDQSPSMVRFDMSRCSAPFVRPQLDLRTGDRKELDAVRGRDRRDHIDEPPVA